MGELSTLPNIGKVLEAQLNDVGIFTYEQLKETGSKQAWLLIKQQDPSACFNRLCGLEGAIRLIRWHNLPMEEKERLSAFYHAHKR